MYVTKLHLCGVNFELVGGADVGGSVDLVVVGIGGGVENKVVVDAGKVGDEEAKIPPSISPALCSFSCEQTYVDRKCSRGIGQSQGKENCSCTTTADHPELSNS